MAFQCVYLRWVMLPFVDFVAAPAAVLSLAELGWLCTMVTRLPRGNRFLCSTQRPQLGAPRLALAGLSALWLLGSGLWLGGSLTATGLARFFGMVVFVVVATVLGLWALALRKQLNAKTGILEIATSPRPEIVLRADDQMQRIALTAGTVRAWTVGNGFSGPLYIQLAIGPCEETGIALFVAPALRHWSLSEGASWLSAYQGWSPVARGGELLDLLAPFTVPANQEWQPQRQAQRLD